VVLAAILGAVFVLYKRRRRANIEHTWARAPGKWTFSELKDPKNPERPHELQPTSPTSNA